MKLDWKALLGIAVTVGLLWWVFQDVDFPEVWAEVRRAHWGWLLASIFVATAGFGVRALRWKVLLAPVKADTALRSRFAAVNIGFMANNLLPARVGEFARAYALGRMEPVPVSAAFGSLVVERFLDGIVLMAFLLLAVAAPTFPADAALREGPVGAALQGFAAIIVVGVAGLFALIRWPGPFLRVVERLAGVLPGDVARPVVDALEAFIASLGILRRPSLLAQAFLWTVGFWTWHGLSFWLGMKAFAIDLDFVAAVFVEAVVGFGVAVPSAPGFFGTFHAAADWALSDVYGVAPARSLAFAFGYHLGGFIPVTLIGLWYAWRIGLSLGDVERSGVAVESAVEREHARWAAVTVRAPAKVNLTLRVGPPRGDGYHDVETVYQAVDLCDEVHVERGPPGVALEVRGRVVPGEPDDNLAVRAARAYAEATGLAPAWRVVLDKRIPAGAGLGGGSSDAAATLRALDILEGRLLGPERLLSLGRSLGSDVGFFLGADPLALGRGRGGRLTALPTLPEAEMVVAVPPVHVSTAGAYAALDAHRGEEAPGALRPEGGAAESGALPPDGAEADPGASMQPRWEEMAARAANDFEVVIPARHPGVAAALAAVRGGEPLLALLSGSGGACFAVHRDAASADRAASAVRRALPDAEVVRTRTLAAWPEPRTAAGPDAAAAGGVEAGRGRTLR